MGSPTLRDMALAAVEANMKVQRAAFDSEVSDYDYATLAADQVDKADEFFKRVEEESGIDRATMRILGGLA